MVNKHTLVVKVPWPSKTAAQLKGLTMSSKLLGLYTKLDVDAVIRLSSYLMQYAEILLYDVRHPIVLP